MDLSVLTGPIVGAIIGYGTNWIAIKMLFRPRKRIKIGKFIVPFTPGIIPKRKGKLAKAMGEMVGNHLFTKNDIQEILLTSELEEKIINRVLVSLASEKTLKNSLLKGMDEKAYLQIREKTILLFGEKIKNGLLKAEVGTMIAKEGGEVIRKKVSSSMLKMFVTDGLIDSVVKPLGAEIEVYIQEHGQEKIIPIVENEINHLENMTIKNLMCNLDKAELVNGIRNLYESFVLQNVPVLLDRLDIAKIVEDKVGRMDVLDLEKLLLAVMKKELGAIVNLGALIGLILGTLNIFL